MGVIAGFWARSGPFLSERACNGMLLALTGQAPPQAGLAARGTYAVGVGSYAGGPGSQPTYLRANRRFLLVADARLDAPEEIARALGIPASTGRALDCGDLLFQALLKWGEVAAERLAGDFAFAFFDGAERRLLLGRDPLGQRPLFWHRGRDHLAFASMPRGLHALPSVERRPDMASLARYVSGLPEQDTASFYADVHRVKPGHLLIATPTTISTRRYWTPPMEERRFGSFDEAVEGYRATLDAAVKARLRDAGPVVATHLSGGWDSSAVTATAARLGPRSLLAFTAAPDTLPDAVSGNGMADEAPLATATARLYSNLEHRFVPTSGYSPVNSIEQAVEWLERPPYNPCNHGWLGRIRREAREAGAGVLITGEIGNWSISAAPNSVLASFVRQGRWREWWRGSRALMRQGRARMRGVAASSFGPWLPTPALRRLAGLASTPGLESVLTPEARSPLEAALSERDFGAFAWPKNHRGQTAAAYSQMDFGAYRKGIFAGWGIDKRDATADLRLIEFCLGLPPEMLLGNGMRRPLARAALADRLPSAVLDERRKGVQAPDWYLDFERDRPRIEAMIDVIGRHDVAGALIDTQLLRRWMSEWPREGWNRPAIVVRYRIALLTALSAGHFAIHASGRNAFVQDGAIG